MSDSKKDRQSNFIVCLRIVTYYLIALLFTLVAAGYLFCKSEKSGVVAVGILAGKMNESINGSFSVRRTSGNLIDGLTLNDVRIRYEDRDWLVIEELYLRYDPLSFFIGFFHLDEVRLTNIAMSVACRQQVNWYLPYVKTDVDQFFETSWKGFVLINKLVVNEATVHEVEDLHFQPTGNGVERLSLQARAGVTILPAPFSWKGWCRVDFISGLYGPDFIPFDGSMARGAITSEALTFKNLRLSTPKSSLSLQLHYALDDSSDVELEWGDTFISMQEFTRNSNAFLVTSGTLSNSPGRPLAAAEQLPMERKVHGGRPLLLNQKISWEGSEFTVHGLLEGWQMHEKKKFTGVLAFRDVDTFEIVSNSAAIWQSSDGQAADRNIDEHLAVLGIPRKLTGSLFLELESANDSLPMALSGILKIDDAEFLQTRIAQVIIPFQRQNESWLVQQGELHSTAGGLQFSGAFTPPQIDADRPFLRLQADFVDFSLNSLLKNDRFPEKINGRGRFNISAHRLDGLLQLNGFRYGDLLVDGLYAGFSLVNDSITFRSVETRMNLPRTAFEKTSWYQHLSAVTADNDSAGKNAREDFLTVPLRLQGRLTQKGYFDCSFSSAVVDAAQIHPDFSGRITISGSITGSHFQPSVDSILMARDFSFRNIALRQAGARVRVHDLFEKPDVTYQFSGKNILLGDVGIERLTIEARETDSLLCGFLDRKTEKGGEAECTLGIGRLLMEKGGHLWTLQDRAVFVLGRDSLAIGKFVLTSDSASVTGWGEITSDHRIAGELTIDDLDLQVVHKDFAETLLADTALSLNVSFSGQAANPSAALAVSLRPHFSGETEKSFTEFFGVPEVIGLNGSLTDGNLSLKGKVEMRNGKRIPVSLALPLQFSLQPWEVIVAPQKLRGTFSISEKLGDIRALAAISDRGNLTADFSFAGDIAKQFVLTGDVEIAHTAIALSPTEIIITEGRGQVLYQPGILTFNDFIARGRLGWFVVNGAMYYDSEYTLETLDLTAMTEKLWLFHQGPDKAKVSGTVMLKGPPAAVEITGGVTVDQAVLKRSGVAESPGKSEDVVVYESRQDRKGIRTTGYFPDIAGKLGSRKVDLTIDIPGTLSFDATDLKMDLSGQLHLVNNPAEGFLLKGQLMTTNGEYRAVRKKFVITEGLLLFDEVAVINPQLTATAVYQTPSLRIIAQVEGTVSSPELTIESEPWLPEEDIRAFILFGRSIDRLKSEETRGLEGGIATYLGGLVLDKFKRSDDGEGLFDAWNIYNTTSPDADEDAVAVGRYLTDDFLLSYEYQMDQEDSGNLHLEYRLQGGFSIESMMQDSEKSGLDLFWKKDF